MGIYLTPHGIKSLHACKIYWKYFVIVLFYFLAFQKILQWSWKQDWGIKENFKRAANENANYFGISKENHQASINVT